MMKYFYEFIGTFFLVFTVGMTVMSPDSAGMMAPLAIGCALAVMVFAGAHVSGGHYNPAVSLAVFMHGKLSLKNLGLYWVAQLFAAVAAAYLTVYYKGPSSEPALVLNMTRAFIAELLFTFALCYVVLNVAVAKSTKGNSFYGLAVGLTIVAGGYAVGAISGAAFNPAVALGITIMNLSVWSNIWIFFAANLIGGALAATLFKGVESKA